MAQQLTREGNFRKRSLKASPMGEKARTICKLALTLLKKYAYSSAGDISMALFPKTFFAKGLVACDDRVHK